MIAPEYFESCWGKNVSVYSCPGSPASLYVHRNTDTDILAHARRPLLYSLRVSLLAKGVLGQLETYP